MIDTNEIRHAMRGSWALALNQTEGLRYFGQSFEDFLRSFLVILYVLPIYILQLTISSIADTGIAATLDFTLTHPLFFVGHLLMIVIEWLTFPVMMIFLARLLGVSAKYGLYIIVNNWSSLMIVALLLPFNLLWNIVPSNDTAVFFFSLLVMILVIRYRWFITKSVLEVTPSTAAGLVLIEVLMSFLFAGVTYKLLGNFG